MVGRGLNPKAKYLFVIDGAKALRAAIRKVFGSEQPVQRFGRTTCATWWNDFRSRIGTRCVLRCERPGVWNGMMAWPN